MRVFLKDATPNKCGFLAPVMVPYLNSRGWEYAHEAREVSLSPGWDSDKVASATTRIAAYLESPVEQIPKSEALELVKAFEGVRACACPRCQGAS